MEYREFSMFKRRLIAVMILLLSGFFSFVYLRALAAPIEQQTVRPEQNPLEVIQSDNRQLTIAFHSPEIHVSTISGAEESLDEVTIQGAEQSSMPGKPQLPVFSALIVLPPSGGFHVITSDDNQQPLKIEHALLTSPVPLNPLDDRPIDSTTLAAPQEDGIQPSVPVETRQTAWLRHYRILRLQINPVQYNPQDLSLTWHKHLTIRVVFDNPPAAESPRTAQPDQNADPFFSLIRENVLNPENLGNWYAETPSGSNAPMAYYPTKSMGFRYRIPVTQTGVYKITYADLVNAGITPSSINPKNIALYNQGDEIAIFVHGENDNTFDAGDYILFYGKKFTGERMASKYPNENRHWLTYYKVLPDGSRVPWKPSINHWFFEKYNPVNTYWLKIDSAHTGLRMATIDGSPAGNTSAPLPYYHAIAHIEQPRIYYSYHFTNEDTFVWEKITSTHKIITSTSGLTDTPLVTHTIQLNNPLPGVSTPTLRSESIALINNPYVSPDHHLRLFVNGQMASDVTWDGKSRIHTSDDFNPSILRSGSNTITVALIGDKGIVSDKIFTDWFEIEYARPFTTISDSLAFQTPLTGSLKYRLGGFSNLTDTVILQVTDSEKPVLITNTGRLTSTITFSVTQTGAESYIAVNRNSIKPVPRISAYQPPAFFSPAHQIDYLIISPPEFLTVSQQFANYRSAHNRYRTLVVNFQDLIDEFDYGIYHPIAIKNFLAYILANWSKAPAYVLVVGDGSWAMQPGNNFYGLSPIYMPPYLAFADYKQGETDSLNLLATVAGTDVLPDFIISRLPVNSVSEFNAYFDKLRSYESAPYQAWNQAWNKNFTFIADNIPDGAGDFIEMNETSINEFVDPSPVETPIRIYENDFGCTAANTANCKAVTNAITRTFNETGTLVMVYNGHASPKRWSHEAILTTTHVNALTNSPKLPFILSFACLDGIWQYPPSHIDAGNGMIELLLRKDNGGIVGAFASTGMATSEGHDPLQRGFFQYFDKHYIWSTGKASLKAKLNVFNNGYNDAIINTYLHFGDPALVLRRVPFLLFIPDVQKH